MKSIKLLAASLMLSATVFGQSIKFPFVNSSEDQKTIITAVETNNQNTIVSFQYTSSAEGDWVQLNKSMYLQDANGEERYNYVKSEGIPLRPSRFEAKEAGQKVNFKVYFEKLKPGTKNINVIERARSIAEMDNGITFLNYFNVDLNRSQPEERNGNTAFDVVLSPPSPLKDNINMVPNIGDMANLGSMVNNMYSGMLTAQLNTLSKPEVINQVAKITKDFYDALIKAGFPADAALKIVIAKPLISTDTGAK